jgi:4-hydroxy-tetrahydrodipicolinate synthase
MSPDGAHVDFKQLEALVNSQIADGIDGLVPVGTTGECPTISHEEHDRVIATVVKVSAGRVPVIAGTGSNCTSEAVRLTEEAKKSGADACLIVNPYYNKPNQEGLYQHFKAIAAVGLPIVLYNIPSRTGITMSPQTVAKLYTEFEEIIAIKEATGSLDIATEILSLCDITVLSGDDSLTLPLMAVGGKGVISVLANLSPKLVKAITVPALEGRYDEARAAHLKTFKLFKSMFIEPNPQPAKAAMQMMGTCNDAVRLPLVPASQETRDILKVLLIEYGLLAPE